MTPTAKSVFFPLIFSAISFALTAQDKIRFYQDTAQMRKEVLAHIPAGTDISAAEKIMKKNKFKCEVYKDKPFSAGEKLYEHLDYLYCDREKTKGLITSRWQIAIVCRGNKVSDVLVSFGLIGP